MGVITQEMNRKKQLETTGEGVVKFIKLDKFPEPKVTTWQGKKIESTHRASVLLEKDGESVWISLGEFKSNRDNITFKVGEEWKELKQGQTVIIDIKKVGEWNGKPTYQSSKSSITILEEATENASGEATSNSKPQSNATTQGSVKASQTGSNSAKTNESTKTFKVYGTVKSINEGVAVVVGEDSKEVQVILGEHGSEVSVGGRLTAQVDGEGNIKSGFKSYGSPKSNQKDDLPIRLGNAVTIANHFTDSYLDVVSIAKQVIGKVDELRAKMKAKYPQAEDYGLSARVGQSVIIAAEKTKDINSFIKVAEDLFIEICEAEQEIREGKVSSDLFVEQKQETKQEVQEPTNTIDDFSGDIDIPEPYVDEFDEDQIPF